MPFCRLLSKLPKAGLLRIKKTPQADIQLLKSGCEVHRTMAQHLLIAKQHSLQTGTLTGSNPVHGFCCSICLSVAMSG